MKNAPDLAAELALLQAKVGELETRATTAEANVIKAEARADAAEQRELTAKERQQELEAKLAAGADEVETKAIKKLQARVDELEVDLRTERESIPTRVQGRAELVVKAKALFGQQYRTDSMSDQAIQEAIIRKLRPNENLAALKSTEARAARCDSLFEERVAVSRKLEVDREVVREREVRTDSIDNRPAPAAPRRHRDAWQEGLPQYTEAQSRRKEA